MKVDRSVVGVDLGGAALWMVIVGVIGWYTLGKPETASDRVEVRATQVSQMRSDLIRLQSALDARTRQKRRLVKQIGKEGKLPQRAPIEQGLKAVTTLGKGREINFLTVEPVSRVYYPGVLEERFQILAEGTFQRHLQFLEAFEECDVWADLTFLRLDQRAISAMGGAERRSEMTLSFYSALPSAELTTN